MSKKVTVTVAPRRSIHLNGVNGKPSTLVGPGQKLEVDESEIERLVTQGFIVDPTARRLSQAEIDAVDLSGYLPGGGASITEDSDQSIKQSRG
jgi:hypothetical protein